MIFKCYLMICKNFKSINSFIFFIKNSRKILFFVLFTEYDPLWQFELYSKDFSLSHNFFGVLLLCFNTNVPVFTWDGQIQHKIYFGFVQSTTPKHLESVYPSTMRHKVYELQLPVRNGFAICCVRDMDHIIFHGHATRITIENVESAKWNLKFERKLFTKMYIRNILFALSFLANVCYFYIHYRQ